MPWASTDCASDRLGRLSTASCLESAPQLGKYPLVVDAIVGTKQLTKVLMDGGNGLNIMYAEMLDAMGIDRSRI